MPTPPGYLDHFQKAAAALPWGEVGESSSGYWKACDSWSMPVQVGVRPQQQGFLRVHVLMLRKPPSLEMVIIFLQSDRVRQRGM